MGKVAISILNYNTYDYTIECIKSILVQKYENFTIFIVDNNSTNKSVKFIEGYLSSENVEYVSLSENEINEIEDLNKYKIIFIKSNKNDGYAAGNNKALNIAIESKLYDYYWIINNDTIVEQDTLCLMVDTLKKDTLKRPVGNYVYYYDDKEKLQMSGGLEIDKKTFKPFFSDREEKIDYLGGVSYLVDNTFIDKYGVMYEGYFLNSEDLEYFYKYKLDFINKHENINAFNIVGKIYHKESATQGKVSPMSNYYYSRNLLYSCKKLQPELMLGLLLFFTLRIIKWTFINIAMAKSIVWAIRDYTRGVIGKVKYFD